MVARRREKVPETETAGSTFRVLRRASASVRRRPKLGRHDDLEEDDLVDIQQRDDFADGDANGGDLDMDETALDEELLDDDLDEDDYDDDDELDEVVEQAPVGSRAQRSETVEDRRGTASIAVIETDYYVETQQDVGHPGAAQNLSAERDVSPRRPSQPPRQSDVDGVDEARLRPVPRRPGRGGYDPDAAEIARAYRYSRRRRVTVVLLVAAVVFALGAYLFMPVLWCGTAVFALLLIGYLGYLRRQVQIEADIRRRRLARLARARQIRPEYLMDHGDVPIAGAPFASPASQVPPAAYRRGREIVDLEDDDPSFDDLEVYEPPISYRRASGQ
jgi:hypothetical protein